MHEPWNEVAMSTPGFPPDTLDAGGCPSWIADLTCEDPNYAVHVVRGLEPAGALEALGAKPRWFRPCELPRDRPSEWTLPPADLGADQGAILLAGRIGAWTFVYDAAMFTSGDDAIPLSANGRVAATSTFSINADASLTYAVDGTELAWINVDDLDLEADLPGMPAELRAAFEAAGTVEHDYLDPGGPDFEICMRAISALAGLQCTIEDLRRIPLLATPFG